LIWPGTVRKDVAGDQERTEVLALLTNLRVSAAMGLQQVSRDPLFGAVINRERPHEPDEAKNTAGFCRL
jgi:hypothetical protein